MFKLPTCPHCKTVYRYKEVVKNSRKKRIECYHCNNTFKNSYYLIIIPVVIMMIFGIVIDTIILNLTGTFSKSIIPLIAVSWIMLFIAFLLAPFFIRYVKIKGQKLKEIPKSELRTFAEKKSKRSK